MQAADSAKYAEENDDIIVPSQCQEYHPGDIVREHEFNSSRIQGHSALDFSEGDANAIDHFPRIPSSIELCNAETLNLNTTSNGKCTCRLKQSRKFKGRFRKREGRKKDDVYYTVPPSQSRAERVAQLGLTSLYFLLALIAFVVTYSLIANLVEAMRHPVRSINFKKVDQHNAPGIAIYPGGASFPACEHYYQNVVTSKVRLSDLELTKRNCDFINMTYSDPLAPNVTRNAIIVRGPSDVLRREAVFIHFRLEDPTRDFFTVSYFLFPDWDLFNRSSTEQRVAMLLDWHMYIPTFALSAGFRFWTKISMKETFFMDSSKHTEFRTEYSVIEYYDQRPVEVKNKTHLFFIFFEWKNNIIEQSFVIFATTPWNIGASLCGVFLTLHKGYTLVQDSIRRVKKEKQKRKEIVTSPAADRKQIKSNERKIEIDGTVA